MDIGIDKYPALKIGGRKILSHDTIDNLRKTEDAKKESKCFIAQEGAQEDGLSNTVDITVFGGNRGGGKANSYITPVATPPDSGEWENLKSVILSALPIMESRK